MLTIWFLSTGVSDKNNFSKTKVNDFKNSCGLQTSHFCVAWIAESTYMDQSAVVCADEVLELAPVIKTSTKY